MASLFPYFGQISSLSIHRHARLRSGSGSCLAAQRSQREVPAGILTGRLRRVLLLCVPLAPSPPRRPAHRRVWLGFLVRREERGAHGGAAGPCGALPALVSLTRRSAGSAGSAGSSRRYFVKVPPQPESESPQRRDSSLGERSHRVKASNVAMMLKPASLQVVI